MEKDMLIPLARDFAFKAHLLADGSTESPGCEPKGHSVKVGLPYSFIGLSLANRPKGSAKTLERPMKEHAQTTYQIE